METADIVDDEETLSPEDSKTHVEEYDIGIERCIKENIDIPRKARLSIKPLYGERYRVNVWMPVDLENCTLVNWKIESSYFVKVEKLLEGFSFTDLTSRPGNERTD